MKPLKHIGREFLIALSSITALVSVSACHNNSQEAQESIPPILYEMQPPYTWQLSNLKGKVKKMTTYHYYLIEENGQYTQGDLVDTYFPITVTEFNPQGYVTRYTSYETKGGEPMSHQVYHYDDKNRLESVYYINETPEGTINARDMYVYDAEGNLESYTSYYGENKPAPLRFTTIATSKGKRLIQVPNERVLGKNIKYYNNQNLLEKEQYFEGDTLYSESLYTYDGKRHLIKTVLESKVSDTIKVITKSTYDAQGNRISLTQEGGGPTGYRGEDFDGYQEVHMQYTYDSKGNILRAILPYPENPIIEVNEIEYYE